MSSTPESDIARTEKSINLVGSAFFFVGAIIFARAVVQSMYFDTRISLSGPILMGIGVVVWMSWGAMKRRLETEQLDIEERSTEGLEEFVHISSDPFTHVDTNRQHNHHLRIPVPPTYEEVESDRRDGEDSAPTDRYLCYFSNRGFLGDDPPPCYDDIVKDEDEEEVNQTEIPNETVTLTVSSESEEEREESGEEQEEREQTASMTASETSINTEITPSVTERAV